MSESMLLALILSAEKVTSIVPENTAPLPPPYVISYGQESVVEAAADVGTVSPPMTKP